ncbi:uncharacterized protein LOC134182717 isoform X2 [Corticium candelabrum]|uniref:uncharacterized protein LOC134182717 isoform X2 n=1 Tax=Corticium candelabrum TaxID=121492 RepID=UPI002E2527FF|nr:uncharacterized protein LOC134182717 isoform X2 [Corticium candelabrum]
MIAICKSIIRDENRGATHFISSVELGAKIYRTKKVTISHATAKFLMKAGLQASNAAGLDVAFKDEHLALASNYESRMFATVDPRVKMDGAKTVVSAEHERVIAYDVRPVWVLVSDPDWQRAMKEASLQYVKEELDHSRPVIASGGPFMIEAGSYRLRRTRTRQLQTQRNKKIHEILDYGDIDSVRVPRYNCSELFINDSDDDSDPMDDPDFGFYIYCKVNGVKLFLCSDVKDESKICLVTSVPHPNAYARFYVEFPSTRRLAPVSRWAKDSLHLLRKTAYLRRRQYLIIDTETRELSFVSGSALLSNQRAMCQFAVENMLMKPDSDEEIIETSL